MVFNRDQIISITEANHNFSSLIHKVDRNGYAIIFVNNQPEYVVIRFDNFEELTQNFEDEEIASILYRNDKEKVNITNNMTLHEAMRQVLLEAKDNIMHASELADEIYNRGLYRQKKGEKAPASQIKLRARHYSNLFQIVDRSYIKLVWFGQ
jgi:antitoxin Phd